MHPFFNKLCFCEHHTAHPANLPIFGEINISHQQNQLSITVNNLYFPCCFAHIAVYFALGGMKRFTWLVLNTQQVFSSIRCISP